MEFLEKKLFVINVLSLVSLSLEFKKKLSIFFNFKSLHL